MFKLSVERLPLDPAQDLASAPTLSRLEHKVDRKDLYRLTSALVDHFIASYPEPPAAIVLDLDHSTTRPMATKIRLLSPPLSELLLSAPLHFRGDLPRLGDRLLRQARAPLAEKMR